MQKSRIETLPEAGKQTQKCSHGNLAPIYSSYHNQVSFRGWKLPVLQNRICSLNRSIYFLQGINSVNHIISSTSLMETNNWRYPQGQYTLETTIVYASFSFLVCLSRSDILLPMNFSTSSISITGSDTTRTRSHSFKLRGTMPKIVAKKGT